MTLKNSLSTLLLLLTLAVPLYAQNGQDSGIPAVQASNGSAQDTADNDELKTQQELVAEVKYRRKSDAEKDKFIAAQAQTIQLQGQWLQREIERGDKWEKAALTGQKVADNSGRMDIVSQQLIDTCRREYGEVVEDNERLRRQRDSYGVKGFVLGNVTGVFGTLAVQKFRQNNQVFSVIR